MHYLDGYYLHLNASRYPCRQLRVSNIRSVVYKRA